MVEALQLLCPRSPQQVGERELSLMRVPSRPSLKPPALVCGLTKQSYWLECYQISTSSMTPFSCARIVPHPFSFPPSKDRQELPIPRKASPYRPSTGGPPYQSCKPCERARRRRPARSSHRNASTSRRPRRNCSRCQPRPPIPTPRRPRSRRGRTTRGFFLRATWTCLLCTRPR